MAAVSSFTRLCLALLLANFSCAQNGGNYSSGVHFVNNAGRTGLLWSSIGLAVFTSLLQGAVTTVVTIAEDQSMWTFRFRIARMEHWWWTAISVCLSTSFGLIILSFLSGNNDDSVGVLALSTATAIAIVRYAIPAWQNRHFIENRWLAWTGSSRTGVNARYAIICGDAKHFVKLNDMSNNQSKPTPSDLWGPAIWSPPGIAADPTAILGGFGDITDDLIFNNNWLIGPSVFDDGLHGMNGMDNISLLWGERQGFRRRVSRGINSVPSGLLKSKPISNDGYNGHGLVLALGVFGRIKGLSPRDIVFDYNDDLKKARGLARPLGVSDVTTTLENSSTWAPRPNKVMRGYYQHAMREQFGTLPTQFSAAATELALIFLDCTAASTRDWFLQNLEEQSLEVNQKLSRPKSVGDDNQAAATDAELQALYRASFVSMILSINFYPPSGNSTSQPAARQRLVRPDLICFALLWLAEGSVQRDPEHTNHFVRGPGAVMPEWWQTDWVKNRLQQEERSLHAGWQRSAAWLLGLTDYPNALISQHPLWPEVIYTPEYPTGVDEAVAK